jgi:hypothetical protein
MSLSNDMQLIVNWSKFFPSLFNWINWDCLHFMLSINIWFLFQDRRDEDSENRRDIPSLNRSKEIHSKIFLEIDLFYFYVFIHPTKYVSISSVFVDTNQMQTKNFHVISFLWDQRTWHSIYRTLLRPLMVWWCRDGHWTMIISPWRGWEKWWWKLADTWH